MKTALVIGAKKAKEKLGWTPTYSFDMMMNEMIDYWINHYSHNKHYLS